MFGLNLTTARYLAAIAVCMVILAITAIVIVVVIRGGVSGGAPSIVGLVSFIATLVALLANLLGTGAVANVVLDVQQKVNGHLAAHMANAASPGQESLGDGRTT
jgi:hypothetical protein